MEAKELMEQLKRVNKALRKANREIIKYLDQYQDQDQYTLAHKFNNLSTLQKKREQLKMFLTLRGQLATARRNDPLR